MNKLRIILIFVPFFIWFEQKDLIAASKISLKSPDNKIEVVIDIDKIITYQVFSEGRIILDKSQIALEFLNGEKLGINPVLISKKIKNYQENIASLFYRNQFVFCEYNELNLKFEGSYGLCFRAYNEGIAYQFNTFLKDEIKILNEIAEFNFDKDYDTYLSYTTNEKDQYAMAFQNTYKAGAISKSDSLLIFLPVTIDLGNDRKVTILESDLESYPGMFIQKNKYKDKSLKGVFAFYPKITAYYPWRSQEYVKEREPYIAKTKGTRNYPWRILAISNSDIEMPVNNLVYALASPNRIGDCSWITPGKASWEWWNDWGLYNVDFKSGINMETYKYHIDFASRFGLEYIILDEGWYDPAGGDMMTVIPQLDIEELTNYAKNKGVGIILWTVFNVLDKQLEEICEYYSKLGIKGFKVDFLDRDDQKAVKMVYRIAEATARNKLILNLHGIYKPTGLNRTFPHILNFEGVFGMEEAKWNSIERNMPLYDVTFPFIRMMSGSVDFTPGAMRNATKKDFKPVYSNPMSQGTRCHQLATYIVFDSPLTMLCDAPVYYEQESDYTRFLSSLPVNIDETKVLQGKMGEYIVTARRSGNRWYVGGLTNWDARDISFELSFLEKNVSYKAILYKDGMNADKQAADFKVEQYFFTSDDVITVHLASGGGFVLSLEEDTDKAIVPQPVPDFFDFPLFYKKYVDADGIPVISSGNVRDEALIKAAAIIKQMLSFRQDIKKKMVEKACKLMIIGANEEVCDLPEYAHICDTPENIAYWNKRARGFGGSPEYDFGASCGEENVLGLPGDRYLGESILVHEFAHIIHMVGILSVDPDFDKELEALRLKAIEKGLWKGTYAVSSKEEYFAEGVQSFFNCNRFSPEPNGVHNAINTRSKLKLYDPELYQLMLRFFPETELAVCPENKFVP